MTRTLVRVLLIIAGHLLASLVTGYVVYSALLLSPTGGIGQDATAGGIAFGLMVTMFVAYFAALPASLVIAAAELKSLRMWWYYAVAGSLIGLGLGWMFSPPPWFPWLGLGFGPVAGLIYWAIAGRKAGLSEPYLRYSIVAIFLLVGVVITISTWGSIVLAFF
jgi:hypothetical protein